MAVSAIKKDALLRVLVSLRSSTSDGSEEKEEDWDEEP